MSGKEGFSKEILEHVSKLALLDLTEEEKDRFSEQLTDLLNYFKNLNDPLRARATKAWVGISYLRSSLSVILNKKV